MKRAKYTAEFKSKALKQILEKGVQQLRHPVTWGCLQDYFIAGTPKLKEPDANPIEHVKALQAQVTKLKAESMQVSEEQNILKKPPYTLPKYASKVGIY